MNKRTIEINGTVARPYVAETTGYDPCFTPAAQYCVGFDLREAGKADEIYAAIAKAIAEKTEITLVYGEDKDNTAEMDAYEAGHKAVVDAMTLNGKTY